MVSPASRRHQGLVDFLTSVLRSFAEWGRRGTVVSAPFQMKTGPELPGREPDVLYVAQEHLKRLRDTYLDGPANLVAEVISPESVGRDRGEKFYEYETGGVREYWLLDVDRQRADFYQLQDDERYHLIEPDGEGVYRSLVLPDFWLRVQWLWQTPPPAAEDVLLEIGGEACARRKFQPDVAHQRSLFAPVIDVANRRLAIDLKLELIHDPLRQYQASCPPVHHAGHGEIFDAARTPLIRVKTYHVAVIGHHHFNRESAHFALFLHRFTPDQHDRC